MKTYKENLSGDEVEEFAKKQLSAMGKDGKEIENGLLESLKNAKNNPVLKPFLATPLLLSIYIDTYKHTPEIPNTKGMFCQRVFESLFYRHDSISKGDHTKKLKCKLDQNGYEEILQIFSHMTYWKEHFTWKIGELENILADIFKNQCNIKVGDFVRDMLCNISIWTECKGEYSFVHRSFQEYFAAHYIKNAGNKKDIYSKIRECIKKGRKKHIIANILYLLEEIDKEQHREYLLLPILKHIQKCIKYVIPSDTYKNSIDKRIEEVEKLINRQKKSERSDLSDM